MSLKMIINVIAIDKPKQVYISDYILPNGKRINNQDADGNFDELKACEGEVFEMHINGVYAQDCRLNAVIRSADHSNSVMIQYDELGMDQDDFDFIEEQERLNPID